MNPPTRAPSLSVSLLAAPEISAAVVYGLHEAFSSIGRTWEQFTGEASKTSQVELQIVAGSIDTFCTTLGVPITADASFETAVRADVVIVSNLVFDNETDPRGNWPGETHWLQEQYRRGATICSVCTGAIMLAEAGLLDGLEATTHWSVKQLFEELYPQVTLKSERVVSPAGPDQRIVTSGGSASWNDLLLYLVARFYGEEEARRTAKIFLFGDRSDGQLPFAAMARLRQHQDAVIAECQVWIAEHYPLPKPVHRMVERSGLPSRTFKRRFNKATGHAPLEYVQTLRVEEAKQMLEAGSEPIDEIAVSVGYEDPNSFRRLFKRTTGISPSQYRQRFQTVSISH